MVLLFCAVSVVLDAFPKAPATPGTCWWQKQTFCTQEVMGTTGNQLRLFGLLEPLCSYFEMLLTVCFSVKTLNSLNWLYNGHEVLAAISFSLKNRAESSCMSWTGWVSRGRFLNHSCLLTAFVGDHSCQLDWKTELNSFCLVF